MKVRYTGPSGALNHRVGAASGEGDVMENGKTYDVGDELGLSLVRSDVNWEPSGKAAEKLVENESREADLPPEPVEEKD